MLKDKIRGIVETIQQRFDDYQFTVAKLADEVGISESYLREIVKLRYGVGPAWLVETMRLNKALDLITDLDESLFVICKSVGYDNPRAFRKAFKKRLGMTPSSCRGYLSKEPDCAEVLKALLRSIDGPGKFRRVVPLKSSDDSGNLSVPWHPANFLCHG